MYVLVKAGTSNPLFYRQWLFGQRKNKGVNLKLVKGKKILIK